MKMRFALLRLNAASPVVVAALVALVAQSSAWGATSNISAVTVYPDRAEVTRTLALTLDHGAQTVEFDGLPASLDDESVTVSGEGSARAVITGLRIDRVTHAETPKEELRKLEEQIEKIDREIRSTSDAFNLAVKKLNFLQSLQAGYRTRETDKKLKSANAPSLVGMLRFISSGMDEAHDAKRRAEKEQDELHEKRRVLNEAYQKKLSPEAKDTKTAKVELEVEAPGSLTLALKYTLPGASWSPLYNLRALPDAKKVQIDYSANVRQQTGEDWKNVSLALATARPARGGRLPVALPIVFAYQERKPQPPAARQVAPSDSRAYGAGMLQGIVTTPEGTPLPGACCLWLNQKGLKERIGPQSTRGGGYYRFSNLKPGMYTLEVEVTGFAPLKIPVRVFAAEPTKNDIQLQLKIKEEVIVIGKRRPIAESPKALTRFSPGTGQKGDLKAVTDFNVTVESSVIKTRYVQPKYPEEALRVGLQGTVILELAVDAEGNVTDVKVIQGGPLGMTESAVEAAYQWKYSPNIVPFGVPITETVRFLTTRKPIEESPRAITRFSPEMVENLPPVMEDTFFDLVEQAPGVATTDEGEIVIRGARYYETQVELGGASMTDPFGVFGANQIDISTEDIEEMQVVTGGSDDRMYGFQGGRVRRITKEGKPVPPSITGFRSLAAGAAAAVRFEAPVEQSITSGDEPVKVGITSLTFDAEVEYLAVPKVEPYVFLKGKLENASDIPLLPGGAFVFIENSLVAATNLVAVAPGEKFEISFGVYPPLSVKRELVSHKTAQRTKRMIRDSFAYKIIVENHHSHAATVSVVEALPLSQRSDIVVKMGDVEPPITEKTEQEIATWKIELAPGEKKEITYGFTVDYPSGTRLSL